MKKRMNKSLLLLLATVMIIMLFPLTALASYADVQEHWAQAAIEKWSGLGIIEGADGIFRPNAPITRGEMAVIADRVMKYQTEAKNTFSDLGSGFYTKAVLKANAAGIIRGYGNAVRPLDSITREECAVMLGRALGLSENASATLTYTDSTTISSWALGYVKAMTASGYVEGANGKFNPKSPITRAEVITILDNAIKEIFGEAKEYTGNIDGTVIVKVPDVILKNMEIKGDLIIAEGVGSGDVTLDNVKVLGKTIVRGGGADSIHIKGDSSISSIIIEKTADGAIRIVTSDGAVVEAVVIDDGTDDIILTGSFESVNVASGVTVKAVGADIKKVDVAGAGAALDVDKNTKVGAITIAETAQSSNISVAGSVTTVQTTAASTSLNISGTVTNLNVSGSAAGSNVNIASGATVSTLTAEAKIEVSNNGTIAKAEVKADGVVLDGNKPSSVTVDPKVTEQPKDSSGNPAGAGTGTGTGGGGGGSTTYYLNYNANGGSGAPANQSGSSNSFTISATIPTKADHIFLGWSASSSAATASYLPGATISGNTLYAVWKSADSIISDGITAVNDISDFDYAELSLNASNNTVTVAITKGTTNVTKVYTDIWQTLVAKLNEYALGVHSVYTGDGTTNSIAVNGDPIDGEEIQDFVKASGLKGAGGGIIAGTDKISCLYGQSVTVYVKPEGGTAIAYTVEFELDGDSLITGNLGDLNTEISAYAVAAYDADSNELTINITDGDVLVSTVYSDIWGASGVLKDPLIQADADKICLSGVTDIDTPTAVASRYDISEGDAASLVAMVKAGYFYPASGSVKIRVEGTDKIGDLIGHRTKVFVFGTVSESEAVSEYTVVFTYYIDDAVVDGIITAGADAVNDIPGFTYANLIFDAGDNEVNVAITDGTKTVTDVYTDIISTLIDELNDNRDKIDYIYTGDEANRIDINGSTVDATQIHNFVKESGLHGPGGTDDEIAGGDPISCLYGQSFDIVIVDVNGQSYAYTVSFELDGDSLIASNMTALNTRISAYAAADYDAASNTLTVDITDADTSVATVYGDIWGASGILKNPLIQADADKICLSGVTDIDTPTAAASRYDISEGDAASLVNMVKAGYFYPASGDAIQVVGTTAIGNLIGYSTKVFVFGTVSSSEPIAVYTVTFIAD